MKQVFINDLRVPVTKISLMPMQVIQVKTLKDDGYWAIQLGAGSRKAKNTSRPLRGHFKKSQKLQESKTQTFPRYIREIKFDEDPGLKLGDQIDLSNIFSTGDVVSVAGVSKGKGFQGGVRRHGFAGGPRTHGQSDRERAPGSIGQTTTPGRVYKGKRMAGRMGFESVTVKNLHVVSLDTQKNELLVSGAIPGRPGTFIEIKRISKGSLADLEKETVATVVEGQGEGEVKEETPNES